MLKKLGNPQDKLKNVVTIVGTNAKAKYVLQSKINTKEAGHKCNLCTSKKITEKKEINLYGKEIFRRICRITSRC